MAITITATVGSASANSYVTEVQFNTYCDERLNVTAYQNANSDERRRAMVMAFRRLQRCNWIGERVNDTQAAAWPRSGARKPDGVGGISGDLGSLGAGAMLSARGGYGIFQSLYDTYDTDEIPQEVKDAQCELALAYLDGWKEEDAGAVEAFASDGVSIRFRAGSAATSPGLPYEVRWRIAPLIEGGRLIRA